MDTLHCSLTSGAQRLSSTAVYPPCPRPPHEPSRRLGIRARRIHCFYVSLHPRAMSIEAIYRRVTPEEFARLQSNAKAAESFFCPKLEELVEELVRHAEESARSGEVACSGAGAGGQRPHSVYRHGLARSAFPAHGRQRVETASLAATTARECGAGRDRDAVALHIWTRPLYHSGRGSRSGRCSQ